MQVAGIIVFLEENLGFFESGALWGAFGEVLERSWKHWCTRNGRGNRQERGYRQDKGVRRGQLTRRKGRKRQNNLLRPLVDPKPLVEILYRYTSVNLSLYSDKSTAGKAFC